MLRARPRWVTPSLVAQRRGPAGPLPPATLLPSRSATVWAREDCDLTLVLLLLAIGAGWAVLWLLTAAVRWGLAGGNR
jgi:hypothetical protein